MKTALARKIDTERPDMEPAEEKQLLTQVGELRSDVRHLQSDLTEFKADTKSKFEKVEERFTGVDGRFTGIDKTLAEIKDMIASAKVWPLACMPVGYSPCSTSSGAQQSGYDE